MSFNFYHIRTDDFSAYAGGGQREVITRDNYEAYFVMYVDDELSAADRTAVESFIQQHPDLEEELVMLQQSVLRADEHIVFEQKENLYKNTAGKGLINELNCEEYFVLYGDDELTNEEKDIVEQFVYHHPQYQAAFELIQQVKLVPDKALAFPDKTYLYRTEEDERKVIAFPWWRFTAAAIALLVIGSLTWYISSQTNNGDVASQDDKTKPALKIITPQPEHNTNAPLAKDDIEAPYAAVDNIPATDIHSDQQAAQNSPTEKNISKQSNILLASHVTLKSEQPPEPPADNEKRFSAKPVEVAVGNSYERPIVKSAIIQQTISEPVAINAVAEKPDDETDHTPTYVLNTSINKTPLRGFFRKVSRVVDKVTNPDDDGKGGIRIANFEIAIK